MNQDSPNHDPAFPVMTIQERTREMQAANQALRESEERYRLIFALNPLPMWIYDGKTLRFLEVNEAAVKNYGYTEDEFRAMTIRDIRPPEDVPALEALVPRIPHGLVNTGEWRHRKKDGTIIIVSIHSHDIDLRGQCARLVLAEDITARKKAEAARQESEQRFRTLAEATFEGIALAEKGVFVDLNDQLAQMMGYPREALIGQPVLMVVAPESRELVQATFVAARQEPYEHLALRRDGSQFPVEVRARSVQIGDRTLRIRSVRDISRHRKMEDELRAMLDEKTTLLKEVHHRVKNNLQIITSLLNLQADRIVDPKVLGLLQDTRQRIRSMALLHETLYGSTNVARINFATYVDNLGAHIFRSYSGSSCKVQFHCHVSGVELDLDQAIPCGLIINELVSNALKHAFPDDRTGEISVEMNASQDLDVILEVADTGVGLPPGYESRPGKTLGLQLVTVLTAQLKGALQVLRDRGTVFRITFKAKPR